MVKAWALPGSPSSTPSLAPAASEGGPSPHFMSAGVSATWSGALVAAALPLVAFFAVPETLALSLSSARAADTESRIIVKRRAPLHFSFMFIVFLPLEWWCRLYPMRLPSANQDIPLSNAFTVVRFSPPASPRVRRAVGARLAARRRDRLGSKHPRRPA